MRPSIAVLIFLASLFSRTTHATDWGSNWSVSGFGTFGAAGTDSNALGFHRDRFEQQDVTRGWGITTDSRLGVQIDTDITQRLHATVQFVARDHVGNFWEQNLEWAFLRWMPSDTLSIRLGRVGADVFVLSDYRNVGFTYPWMRPPHEFYGALPIYHLDGIDLSQKFNFQNNLLTAKLFVGHTDTQMPADPVPASEITPASTASVITIDAPSIGANLVYETSNWRLRLGYAFMHLLKGIDTQPLADILTNPLTNIFIPNIGSVAPHLAIQNTDLHYYSLGAHYDDGDWLAQTEASYTNTQTVFFPDTFNSYVSLGRRFAKVTAYALYGIAYSFDHPVSIPEPVIDNPLVHQLHQFVDTTINHNGIHEQSVSLGLRWDVLPKVALKTQWTHYWFGTNGTRLWQTPANTQLPDETNLWSVGVDFIF